MKISRRSCGGKYRAEPPPEAIDALAPVTSVIAEADWIIDLDPNGGSGGCCVVVAGTPEALVTSKTARGW